MCTPYMQEPLTLQPVSVLMQLGAVQANMIELYVL